MEQRQTAAATRQRAYMTWNEAVQASSVGLECHVIDKAASVQHFDYCLHRLPDGMTIRIVRNAATGQAERSIIAPASPLPTPRLVTEPPLSPLALPQLDSTPGVTSGGVDDTK